MKIISALLMLLIFGTPAAELPRLLHINFNGRGASQMYTLDADGHTEVFTDRTLFRASISPGERFVGASDFTNGDIYFYDSHGQEIAHYAQSDVDEAKWFYIRGWLDDETAILVRGENWMFFYTLDLRDPASQPQPFDSVNQHLIWDMTPLPADIPPDFDPRNFISFSPNLQYVLAPAALATTNGFSFPDPTFETTAFWDIRTAPTEPEYLITNSFPLSFVRPAWSSDGETVVYIGFHHEENQPSRAALYLASGQTPPALLTDIDCESENLCLGIGFSWSPDGSMIAYWGVTRDAPRTYTLKIVGIDGRAIPAVYRTDSYMLGIKWSPDSDAVAFFRKSGTYPDASNVIVTLNVPDADGSSAAEYPTDADVELVGWLSD